MRIIGGEWKGRKLSSRVSDKTRPTTDEQREAIFNILLQSMGHEPGKVLDLFAGSGALSLEALSWGATSALLVEKDPQAIQCIEENFSKVPIRDDQWSLLSIPWTKRWASFIENKFESFYPFQSIFCDPPYGKGLVEDALHGLERVAKKIFDPNCVLIVETSSEEKFPKVPPSWHLVKEREKGGIRLLFYKREEC